MLDVTVPSCPTFAPLALDGSPNYRVAVALDRSPGPLVGVCSEVGPEDCAAWVAENPSWLLDFGPSRTARRQAHR